MTSFRNFVQEFFLGGGALSWLASLALLSDEKKAERGVAFGFAKISVLLSERLHRIVALDTARRGTSWFTAGSGNNDCNVGSLLLLALTILP